MHARIQDPVVTIDLEWKPEHTHTHTHTHARAHTHTLIHAHTQDPVVTIDLEWKPEHGPGQNNPVSLMQLSSATVCVLLHTSSMGFTLPAAVK